MNPKQPFGYSGSKTNPAVGGAATSAGYTQNGKDYTSVPPPLKENVYGGGAATKSGGYSSSDPASPYYTPRSPVSSLSTSQGKNIITDLQKGHATDMERLSVEASNRQVNTDNFKKSVEASDRRNGGLSAEEVSSLGGDLSTYTHNPTSGLYVPNSASSQPVDDTQSIQKEIDTTFSKQEGLVDASSSALMNSIKQSYQKLTDKQKATNTATDRNIQSYGARSGVARYTPGQFSNIESAALKEEISKLDKIATTQNAKLASAEQALASKKYTLFAQERNDIAKLRTERMKSLDKIQTAIQKKQDIADKAQIKASREGAIAGIISQGITDPAKILESVNYDANGNLVGDVSLKEITDTLKGLSPTNNLKDLDTSTRTFFGLKGMGELPPEISNLPEDQQLMAWLNKNKKTTTQKGATGPKITFKEAKDNGFPISTVGMTEQEVVQNLNDTQPPKWFLEMLKNETGSAVPSSVNTIWDKWRKPLLTGKAAASTSSSGRSI